MIRDVENKDAKAITDIYNYYIRESIATFEETEIPVAELLARIIKTRNYGFRWLVAEEEGKVIGYACVSKWREKSAYKYSVEFSVYLAKDKRSKGLGTKLYQALFDSLKGSSIRNVIAGVTLPNPASVALQEKFGMKKVAHFSNIGFKFGEWLDVGYWQIDLKAKQ